MTASLTVDISHVGLAGPGLEDWAAAQPVLKGDQPYQPAAMDKPSVKHLPARDRRRYTFTIALAITTAMMSILAKEKGEIPAVFACSGGDTDVINKLCSALIAPGSPVSPQQFVNSVHNAPAGYWSIAEENNAPTTSLSAFDSSFAAGLLEAAVQVHAGRRQIVLVAYDVPAPMPIWPFRPLSAPFATAMILSRPGTQPAAIATLDLGVAPAMAASQIDDSDLERLRQGNPAARALPLLSAIAQRRSASLVLPYLAPQAVTIQLTPC